MTINELFPDKYLADVVAETLFFYMSEQTTLEQIKFKQITHKILLTVDKIIIFHKCKIKSLEGLQHLKNLNELILPHCEIEDISPIKELTKLEILNLKKNRIKDISPLSNLINLKNLNLENNLISDLSPLKNLTKLWFLGLSNNKIKDISTLRNLKNLKDLYLLNNDIKELPKCLSNSLRCLHLNNTKIQNFDNLNNLTDLEILTLPNNPNLTTLPLLKSLMNLSIAIDYPSFGTAQFFDGKLSNAQRLKAFTTYDRKIKDYTFIQNLPNLKVFQFTKDNEVITVNEAIFDFTEV